MSVSRFGFVEVRDLSDSGVGRNWESEVTDILSRTLFPKDWRMEQGQYVGPANRSVAFWECGQFWSFRRCIGLSGGPSCGWESVRYKKVCNLRGHFRCCKGLRYRMMKRYLPRLESFPVGQLRHITFTYARVPSDEASGEADYILSRARTLCKAMFQGSVVSCELTEKVRGQVYVHVHAVVVGRPGERFDYTVINAGWRQLAGSYVKVSMRDDWRTAKGMLWYVLGYVLKGVNSGEMTPQEYVDFLVSFQGKRMVRALGCLFGSRKGASGKPEGWVGSSEGDVGAGARVVSGSLETNSIMSSSFFVCPRCGGDVEYASALVVEDQGQVEVSSSETIVSDTSNAGVSPIPSKSEIEGWLL